MVILMMSFVLILSVSVLLVGCTLIFSSSKPKIKRKDIMSKYSKDTLFLCNEPSFIQGAASVLDLGGTLSAYNLSPTPEEADARAIANDWAIVGKDIRKVMKEFGEIKTK